MKKLILFTCFIAMMQTSFAQQPSYDSSFKELYKALALHPGYRNGRGLLHDSVIKKWDKDIKIFIQENNVSNSKEIISKLKQTIAVISPALNNKISISFTNNKAAANYLVNIGPFNKSGWYLKWDQMDNIYSCVLNLNTNAIFNLDQQKAMVSHYFIKSLGDFVATENTPATASNMRLWRQDINDVDLQILKLHYSDDIKSGMAEKDIDQVFAKNDH